MELNKTLSAFIDYSCLTYMINIQDNLKLKDAEYFEIKI